MESTAQEIHSPSEDGNHTSKQISEMSDREIAEETLTHLRNVGTFVMQFQGMSPTQLIKAMLTGGK